MSLTSNIRNIRSRSISELTLLFEAYIILGIVRIFIVFLPFRKITNLMGLDQADGDALPSGVVSPLVVEISWAIKAAAYRTPWESTCLVQGLTGILMLSRRGIESTLYLGVAKSNNGNDSLDAHAWLCCGNMFVTGGGGCNRFIAVSSFTHSCNPNKSANCAIA